MSAAPSKQLSQEAVAELEKLYLDQVKKEWSLEDLTELSRLFRDSRWKLYLRYLHYLEELLSSEIWAKNMTWDRVNFLRGQHRVLETINKAPLEVERIITLMREERSDGNTNS